MGLFVNTFWCYSRGMSIDPTGDLAALNGLSHLDDPLRRQLYEYVNGKNRRTTFFARVSRPRPPRRWDAPWRPTTWTSWPRWAC